MSFFSHFPADVSSASLFPPSVGIADRNFNRNMDKSCTNVLTQILNITHKCMTQNYRNMKNYNHNNALSDTPQASSAVSISYHLDLMFSFIEHIYISPSNSPVLTKMLKLKKKITLPFRSIFPFR